MRHKSYREWLRLLTCDELDQPRTKLLKDHLAGCSDCRVELDALRRVHEALSESAGEEPSAELLQQARAQLRSMLAHPEGAQSNIHDGAYPRYRLAAAAAAVLFAGFLLGYGTFLLTASRTEPHTRIADNPGRIENVQFVDQRRETSITGAAPDQEVEFTYDVVNQVRVRGRLGESRIQKILALALVNERNPGVRLQSAAALQSSLPGSSDPETRNALIDAMVHDENPGVRMQAMETLARYPYHDSIKRAFLQVLMNDPLPGLRIQAINSLIGGSLGAHSTDPEIRNAFKQKLVNDENSYIRLQARKFMKENSL